MVKNKLFPSIKVEETLLKNGEAPGLGWREAGGGAREG
jgi:hypothetical protein